MGSPRRSVRVPATARVACLLVAGLLLAPAPMASARGGKPERARNVSTPLGERIHQAVGQATGDAFWGVVLVARGGEVLLARGYGAADYDAKENLPDTLFELASTSKQFAATAILRLEQQKKLKTSDTIDRFFPGAPKDKRKVTVDHLLHHTAGLSPELGVPYAWSGTRDVYVREMLARPLDAEPGARFSYSNVGYALLAAIVEVVTKDPFEDYVRKELLARAGLVDTGFIGDERLAASGRDTTRKCADCLPEWTAARWHWGWGYRGMGGVVSTALDLLAWDRALRGDKVLGPAAREKLYTPALEGYACGWKVETTDRGTKKVSHAGGVRGYAVQYARWLEEDAVVVVLSNGATDVHAVERAVAALLFEPARVTADLDASGEALSEGRAVERTTGLSLDVAREGGTLLLRLRLGTKRLAEIRTPREAARRLADELEQALASSAYPAPDEPAALEGGLYLAVLESGTTKAHLDTNLALRVLPRYEGRGRDGETIRDPRAVLILEIAGRGWPVMVKMNPAATRALLESLRKP